MTFVHGFKHGVDSSRSEDYYAPSMVYRLGAVQVDGQHRVSESAVVPQDRIIRGIQDRALSLQGWRGNSLRLEPLKAQRYEQNGFYDFHYDWDAQVQDGNRVTTLMVYLKTDCIGGGTDFPRLPTPTDRRWCRIIECGGKEYEGVTFKPVVGAAIFWENMHANGSFDERVLHAGLPIKSGEKIGLNIWGWGADWTSPDQQ